MLLGIEIGGTKLQVGVASEPCGELLHLEHVRIDRSAGANGILNRLQEWCTPLVDKYSVSQIGIGFGGPVDTQTGTVRKSYHVAGWDRFPLAEWCADKFRVPAAVDNDCNVSALAEATIGAGADKNSVLYVTVGTGIGAGLVVEGTIFGTKRPTVSEIGHLRPFPVQQPSSIVETFSSGPGIAEQFRLLQGGTTETAEAIANSAAAGDALAVRVMEQAVRILGWAIAQAITITAPEIVVVGGGVSNAPNSVFLAPLHRFVAEYVMDSLEGSYDLEKAALGDEVVVHGAIAVAASMLAER